MRKLALAALVLAGCTTTPPKPDPKDDPKAHDNAEIHFNLGAQAQANQDVRQALNEYQVALQYDPNYADPENGLGLLYHLSFRQLDEAEKHYQRALAIKPDFSKAKVNLAALYLDEARYDEAIALDEQVLKDLQYQGGFLVANNEGWAYYKKGDAQRALALIKEAVRVNPDFCQGYRNLGIIYAETGQVDAARLELDRMVKKCPEAPQGWYELGKVQLKQKDEAGAKASFAKCRDHAGESDPLFEDCAKLSGGSALP